MHDPRWIPLLLTLGLAAPGCIIVADDDDDPPTRDDAAEEGTGDDDDDDDDDAESGDGTGDDDDDDDDDGLVCGDNVLVDPGFEGGSPNDAWHEDSLNFDSPLCDDSCSEDDEARPHDGDWFAWFGGLEEPEAAALAQQFTVQGDAAFLRLQLAMNAASGTGDDQLWISIDGNEVLSVSDLDTDLYGADYQSVEIDLSEFADGQSHELRIEADVAGDGVTNFFVDSVEIVGCTEPLVEGDTGTGGESGDESGDESGAADESGGGSGDEASDESGDEAGTSGGEDPDDDESGEGGSSGG